MLNRDVEEVVSLIRSGRLSEAEEVAALSDLRRSLSESDHGDDSGVVYATPYWSAEPAPVIQSSSRPQTAVVLSLASAESGPQTIADIILKGLEIKERIDLQRIDLQEDARLFINLASTGQPDSHLSRCEALGALSMRSFASVLLLILDNPSPDRQRREAGNGPDETPEIFTGNLLYVFGVVKAILRRNASADIRCVTVSGHQRVLSIGAAVSGLLKTLVLEHGRFSARTIWEDGLSPGDRSTNNFLLEEIGGMEPGTHLEVRLSDGVRYVRQFREIEIASSGPAILQSGDVVLLTGGLGGVGRILAESLVSKWGARIVLAGRTTASMLSREQAAFLQRHASNVVYVETDVSVLDEVRSLVDAAERRFGRIDGVIHAAGVTRDGWLSGSTLSSIADVLRPKVLGACNLAELIGARVRFFIHFSSLASYRGNVGQSAYACANAFLDHHSAICREMRSAAAPRCVTLAINWPLWQSGGMRPSKTVADEMERACGLRGLSNQQGVRCFEAALGSGHSQVLVAAGDVTLLRQRFLMQGGSAEETTVERPLAGIRDEHREAVPPQQALLQTLQSLAGDALDLSIDNIDPEEALAEYGFDSISLTGFAAKINKRYGFIQLDSSVFLEHSSLNELSAYLYRRYASAFDEHHADAASPAQVSSSDQARKILLEKLIALVSETTRLQPGEIEPDTSLSEYGFDSISLTELSTRISKAWEWVELDAAVFLMHPTLHDLCEHMFAKYASRFAAEPEGRGFENQAASEGRHSKGKRYESQGRPTSRSSDDIAVIGIGGRFPGARNTIEFWNNLNADVSCISEIPRERWDWRDYSGNPAETNQTTDCHYGAFIEGIDRFDPLHFDISPREAEFMDPQQRLLLQGTWETLENAGYSKSALANSRIGVFIGVEKHDYLSVIGQSGVPLDGYVNTGNSHSMLVNRISWFFDWTGPSVAVDTACSSSFSALSAAVRSLRGGESTLALAGGINVLLAPGVFVINRKMRMLTAEDHVKPFDLAASGHLYGEGLGLVLLKPLSAAIRDRDCIYGVIKGMSVRHGGKGVFLTAPNAKAHVEVIEEALKDAKAAKEEIDYIEAQGSSDRLADRVELGAYHSVFGSRKAAPVKIATIKGHTGHMGAASGVIGVIKAILSLRNNRIIGIRNLQNLNWDSSGEKFGCEVIVRTDDWQPKVRRGEQVPRIVGVHNFGYGGVNGHLILEEFSGDAVEFDNARAPEREIILLSARTEDQVREMARRLGRYLSNQEYRTYGLSALRLRDIAFTLAIGRESLDVRAALLVCNTEELTDKLERLGRGEEHVAGSFQGKIRSKKELRRSHVGEDALNAESLAESWVQGAAVDWQQWFGADVCRRVPLPTYWFATETYWVPRGQTGQKLGATREILHPLLHIDTSSGSQTSFRSFFSGEELFLRDHVIHGQRVLPGVACLEMARAAVHRWARFRIEDGIEIRNVVWMRPIVVSESGQTVEIRLAVSGEREVRFEIETPAEASGQRATTHCQGTAILRGPGPGNSLDFAAIRARMDGRMLPGQHVYETYRRTGVTYGPFYRCIERINVGKGEVLARIAHQSSPAQPEESVATEPLFLHPGVMDSALQAIFGLVAGTPEMDLADGDSQKTVGAAGRGSFLPFALERLTVTGPTRSPMWAWVRRSETNRAEGGLQKVDIDLCSDSGDVVVSFRGVSNRPLETPTIPETIHERGDNDDAGLHPVAHDPSDPVPTRFLSQFSGREYYLADHGGMLLGAAYLEMARAAGSLYGHEVTGFANVVWTRPIRVGDFGKKVWTLLSRDAGRVNFRICSTEGGSELTHAQGRLLSPASQLGNKPVPLNIAAIRARCSATANASECAVALQRTHGPRVLSIERLDYGDDEAIAELKLPKGVSASGDCRLHPSMLNGALVASVLPPLIRGDTISLPAPFALQELSIYGAIPERAYAWMRGASTREAFGPASRAGANDIDIADFNGEVAISIRGFSMVTPGAAPPDHQMGQRSKDSGERGQKALAEAILQRLLTIVAQRQKLKLDYLDPDRQLTRYGFDSVGFTELCNQLNTELGLDLMPTVFFEYPDLRSVATYLADAHAATLSAHPEFQGHRQQGETGVDRVAIESTIDAAVSRSTKDSHKGPRSDREPIVVVGINGRFPGSPDANQFWRNIEANRDLITEVPKDRWDWRKYSGDSSKEPGRKQARWGGFIEGVDLFDPLFFSISPLEAEAMDPQLRILLEATWAAIEDAGYRASSLAGSRTGFFVGASTADYKELWRRANDPLRGAHGLSFVIANRVSWSFDFRGPSEVIDTACSSSLIAVHRAIESIRHGSCDMALACGVNVMATPTLTLGGIEAGMLSGDGRCKTFDSRADGYGRGEGVGVVFLKPLSTAVADGDRIYGVILGSAENHGGKAASPTAPNPASQRELLVSAYTEAGVDPRSVTYIEAHGTGTELGDPIEVEALKAAFSVLSERRGLAAPDRAFCALGSVKANIGHLEAAAGISGLIKVLLMMRHRKVPGNPHLKQENKLLRLAGSPFYLAKETTEWHSLADESGRQVPRRAGISSFGIGGSNAHLIVEEPIHETDDRPASTLTGPQLIVLSAKTAESLTAAARNLLQFAIAQPTTCLADLAWTLQWGREAMEERLAFVAESMPDLETNLTAWLGGERDPVRFHQAALRDNRESTAAFASDEDFSSLIDAWMAKGKYARLLEVWVKGLDLDWEKLPRTVRPRRIGLPTYPFARERYWVPDGAGTSADSVSAGPGRLHPLVHRNTSDLSQQRFSSRFSGREFFLADHVVGQRRVLPAVAYLEMARAAVEAGAGFTVTQNCRLRLRSVVWVRPLSVSPDDALHVHVGLSPDGQNGVRFEIYTNPSDGDDAQVHCQGFADIEAPAEIERLDLQRLRVELGLNRIGAEQCYQAFASAGIEYGPAFRGIEEILYNSGQVLATLHVPLATDYSVEDGVDGFKLHPALLDSALQASIALSRSDTGEDSSSRKVSLPFALDECQIFAPCTPRMVAWIRVAGASGAGGRVQKADLDLCSEDGRVCVRLKGLSARELVPVERSPSAAGLLLYHPGWKADMEAVGTVLSKPVRQIVIFCEGFASAAEDIKDSLPGVECLRIEPAGKNVGERFEKTAVEVFSTIKNLISSASKETVLVRVIVSSAGEWRVYSGLSGLLLTAQFEQPRIQTSLVEVDLDNSPASLRAAIRDSLSNQTGGHVKYTVGRRQVLSWRESSPVDTNVAPPWKDGGVYLVTGGAGGLGLIFAREIAGRTSGVVLILAGRSDLSPDQHARVDMLRSAGATVTYKRVDVSDLAAVQTLVGEINDVYGRLDGVFHAAGLLRDQLILRKSSDSFREVLAPKVKGAVNLDHATRDLPLDFFVLFSSGSGAFGNVGQSDYATANSFMDAFAACRADLVDRQERHGRTISINWPLWEHGGMQADEATRKRLQAQSGLIPLRTSSGIDAFYRAFAAGESRVLVLEGEVKRIRALFSGERTKAEPGRSKDRSLGAGGNDQSFETRVAAYLKQVVSTTLKLPLARVEVNAPLERYGIDSIVVLQLTNKLEETFGPLSKTLFFEYQTLAELSRYFVDAYAEKLRDILGVESGQAPAAAISAPPASTPFIRRNTPASPTSVPARVAPRSETSPLDIAIIGLAGRYPESKDLEEYWNNLREGRNCITEVPPSRWNWRDYYTKERGTWGHYSKWGGFISDVDKFDPLFFGISPREAEFLDPQERLFLEHAWMALEDAGYRRADLQQSREDDLPGQVGVYAGVMFGEYQLLGLEAALSGHPVATASSYASIANRVSYVLNLHGPSMTVDTMCSSSLTSLHLACQDLKHGRTDMAIAGGVNVSIHPNKYFLLSGAQFISTDGRCASFGAGGDGYVPGEGVGVAVLKRLADAERDGDHIYGVIKGSSVNHGGKTNGYSVPNPNAQQMAVASALRESGIDPRRISYVEAHGTGTALGDPIEITGLTKAFRKYTSDTQYCWIGSAKSNIGHCESAAGIAGVTKVLLQMKHREIAPSIHSATLNPHIEFGPTPFVVNQELRKWEPAIDGSVTPLIAAVSSFGAGGSNAHIVIQEYQRSGRSRTPGPAHKGPYPIVLSARNEERLYEYAAKFLAFVRRRSPQSLTPVAVSDELRSEIESAARSHLSRALSIDAAQIGADQRFAEYGVEPFDKDQLLRALQSEFGIDIDEFEFIGKNSIAEISDIFAIRRQSRCDDIEFAQRLTVNDAQSAPDLAEIAWTLQVGREPLAERLGVVVDSFEELEQALSAFVERDQTSKDQRVIYRGQAGRSKENIGFAGQDDDLTGLIATWIENRTYGRILELWVRGFEFDWSRLYGDARPHRASLPTYPFARERYWIQTSVGREPGLKAPVASSTSSSDETGVLACSLIWRDAAAQLQPPEHSRHIVVLAGPAPCSAENVEAQLRDARCVQLRFDSDRPDERFRTSAIQVFELIKGLLGNRSSERILIQILIAAGDEARLMCGLSGLLHSAQLENPKLVGQILEFEPGETKAGLIDKIAENTGNPDDSRVRYLHGKRLVARLEEFPTPGAPSRLPWRDGGVYLITGGAGGLGLVFAKEIAARVANATIVLAGRSPESAEIRRRFADDAFTGSVVRYCRLDVCEPDAVEKVIADVRRTHGGLHGIIHAAGVIHDNFIVAKTAREFDEVLGPKVSGTVNLDRATREIDLDFFVLFSSLSGAFGNPGQSDYAAANAFVDAYAEYRYGLVRSGRRRGLTLSINWPLWRDGGMRVHSDIVSMMARTTGMIPMESASGIEAFYAVLASGRTQVMVMEGDVSKMRRSFLTDRSMTSPITAKPAALDTGPNVLLEDGVLLENVIRALKALLGEAVKLPPEAIDPEAPIESYGVESVAIGQMTQRLQIVFPELPRTLFYEFPTLDAVARHLMAEYRQGCIAWGRPERTRNADSQAPFVAAAGTETTAAQSRGAQFQLAGSSAPVEGMTREPDTEPIAIIGLAGRFPEADSLADFWENLRTGKACFTEVPPERWSLNDFHESDPDKAIGRARSYCKMGGFLDRFAEFDPLFFNIAPVEAYRLDPHERLLLTMCWEAMENSGHSRTSLQKLYAGSVGVFAGVTKLGFHLHTHLGSTLETSRLPSTSFSSMANRISYQLNLCGPSMAIDTMCSSSVTAIHEACEHIRRGDCQVAFAASANLYLHPRTYIDLCLGKLVTDQPEPRCFSATGSGFVPGEAAGAVLLKPLARAVRDGDPIHGVIRATAINHGGKTTGYTAPNLAKQAEVVSLVLKRAGCHPDSIDFIESAANGSALGDAIELQALKQAFKSRSAGRCWVGTLKASVGHAEAASGISQLTKVLLQMQHDTLAPTRIGEGRASVASSWEESPFELLTEARAWPRRNFPRRALITSFGAGGSYGAMIVEDYTTQSEFHSSGASPRREYLFVLSARTDQQLREYASRLSTHLKTVPLPLVSVAFTLQQGRDAMDHRLAIIAADQGVLVEHLEAFAGGREHPHAAMSFHGRKGNLKPEGPEAIGKRDLKALAQLWLAGCDDIAWSELYEEPVPRCSLPAYPFAARSFWYTQPEPAAAVDVPAPQHRKPEPIPAQSSRQSVDKIEKALASVIRQILLLSDDDPLDVDANFSELGLDSVNGVHFVKKLAETQGVELRDTIIFDYPSLSALAGYIAALSAAPVREPASVITDEPSASDTNASASFKRHLGRLMREHAEIVPLQVEGDGPLLFCLPPMSGDVGLYTRLSQASNQRFRVIGIKSRGFLSGAEPLDTIPAIAAQAVALVTAILPEGPVHLFGSSMGGAVACECARQLQLRGRSVGALFLVEAPLVENDADALLWTCDSLDNWIMNANFLMISVLHMDPDFRRRKAAGKVKWPDLEIRRSDVEGMAESDVPALLVDLIRLRGATMPEGSLSVRLRSMAAIHMANLRALSAYRAEPLAFHEGIKAILLRTRSAAAVSADVYNPGYLTAVQQAKESLLPFFEGWKRVVPGVVTEIIEGENHFDVLSDSASAGHISDVIATSLTAAISSPVGRPTSPGIAVIGMSGRFPGAPNTEAFWDLLKKGDSAFTGLPADREWRLRDSGDVTGSPATPLYVKRGGFLDGIDRFDPLFFGIPPREAESMDPAERLFLEETWKAIEDAGVDPAGLAGKQWGVFCGGGGDFTLRLKELSGVSPHITASGIPGRVSYSLSLTGPCVAVDAGCASSMLAIAQAADALVLGQCDVAIAGGVWVFSTPNLLYAGCHSRLFSEDEQGHALSAQASGMMAGEAVGALILKPLEQAVADGDRIYGVIEAWGVGHNGHTNGMAAPSVSGQAALYKSVYRRFGIDPATISLLEANAVGTPLGDSIEVQALAEAFRTTTSSNHICALGTVENNIGHAFQASGIAHVIKVLLALEHKQIPATANAGVPNSAMDLERTPFFINRAATSWTTGNGRVRRAAMSSFGTTGINAHLVISEAPPAKPRAAWPQDGVSRFHLIALSAKTRAAAVARCHDLLEYLSRQENITTEFIGRISANLMLRRSHAAERYAFVVADSADFKRKLSTIIRGESEEAVFSGSMARGASASSSNAAATLTRLVATQRRADRDSLVALAELYVQGIRLDLSPCFSEVEKEPLSLPAYPFERRRCWPSADRGPAEMSEPALASPANDSPANGVSREIQAIVAEVSGFESSELPVAAPLSRLGLDSLMTMRVLALINERFSLELHLADIAERGSIQDLSSLVETEINLRSASKDIPVVASAGGGPSPGAAWLFQRFSPAPRGLSVRSIETGANCASSLKITETLAKLIRSGVALCHDGVQCHLIAHHSLDAVALYESLSLQEQRDLLSCLPADILIAPVSQEQERNLYHSEEMKVSSWNVQQTFELPVAVDRKLLEAAMSRLIGNHDILRTHYLRLHDSWAQVIVPEMPVEIRDIGETTIDALGRMLEMERRKLVDVYRLPIFKVWIAQAGGTHHLSFITHHSLADAFTPGMLFSELMTCYAALREARVAPARQIGEQYWQFALRQFDRDAYNRESTLDYWRNRLHGREMSMQLPWSRDSREVGPELLDVAGAEPVTLSRALTERTEAFSREHELTHTQLFTAAIAMVLIHGLRNAGAMLRFVHSQRGSASLMNTPGEFTNISFLALDIDSDAVILDTLRDVRRRSLEALKFSRVNFRELLKLTDLSDYEGYYRQIGDVMIDSIDFTTGGIPALESRAPSADGESSADSRTSVDVPAAGTLMFQLLKLDGQIRLVTFFRKHLLDKAAVRDLCHLVVTFAEGMVARPTQRVSDLISRGGAELQRVRDFSGPVGSGVKASSSPYFTECQRVNAVRNGRPVFWVHGAFGDASVYIPLAREIDRPFYGIQARGLFDDRAPLSGVKPIASFYSDMIKAIQPEGPYDLGGYSVGGIFAYEIARQLLAEGHEVRSLCLVDTLFHPYYETLLHCSGTLRETYEFVSQGLVEMFGSKPEVLHQLRASAEKDSNAYDGNNADVLLRHFAGACCAAGVARPRVWIENYISRMVRLLRGYRIDEYPPIPLPGRVEDVRYFRRHGGWVFHSGSGSGNGQYEQPQAVVDYWSEWSTLLPNAEYREVIADDHMSILRDDRALRVIGETCRRLYGVASPVKTLTAHGETGEPSPHVSSPLQNALAAIVSQVLCVNVSEVEPSRALSSCGMDSFAATQLLQRLRADFDLDLDMQTMFTFNTLADIAAHIERRNGRTCNPEPDSNASADREPPVALTRRFPELVRLNNRTEGRPVFWFHGGLGGVEVYRPIAEASGRPFFGIQARGWMSDREPLCGIQSMAAYYVHIMLSVQARGPWDVGGYSLGGLIAYETIRQLQELGEVVSTLVMVDTFDTSAFRNASISDSADALAWPILNFALQSQWAARGADLSKYLIRREELDGLDGESKLSRLITLAGERGLRGSESQLRAMVRHLSKVHQAYEVDRYRIRPLAHPEEVECRYFRNRSGLFFGELEGYYAAGGNVSWDHAAYWAEWLEHLPDFQMTDVNASNHMTMLTEPQARDVIVNSCRELYSPGDKPEITALKTNAVNGLSWRTVTSKP